MSELERQDEKIITHVHKIDCDGLDLVGLIVVIAFFVMAILQSIWG